MIKSSKRKKSIAPVIAVVLIISLAFGFVFDLTLTLIEKSILYPKKYSELVEKYSKEYSVPDDVIYSVIKAESKFDSAAVSHAGAIGLMQLMPDTFEWLAKDKLGESIDSRTLYDAETNIKYGTYYLSMLYARYGRWDTAFAAYNAGPGRVDSWLSDESLSNGDGGLDEIPIKETKKYVKKVNKYRSKYISIYGGTKND